MSSQPFLSLKDGQQHSGYRRHGNRHGAVSGHQLDESTLAQLCVSLEPTDSTVFRQLTLFDHNDASTQIACESQPQLDLLVLESPETLLTADYHRIPRQSGLLAGASSETRMGKSTGSLYQSKPLSDGRSRHAERDRQPVAVT
jgi:hypothetical protein